MMSFDRIGMATLAGEMRRALDQIGPQRALGENNVVEGEVVLAKEFLHHFDERVADDLALVFWVDLGAQRKRFFEKNVGVEQAEEIRGHRRTPLDSRRRGRRVLTGRRYFGANERLCLGEALRGIDVVDGGELGECLTDLHAFVVAEEAVVDADDLHLFRWQSPCEQSGTHGTVDATAAQNEHRLLLDERSNGRERLFDPTAHGERRPAVSDVEEKVFEDFHAVHREIHLTDEGEHRRRRSIRCHALGLPRDEIVARRSASPYPHTPQ